MEWLVNSPRHSAKASVIVPILAEKLFGGVELQYLSKRKTLTGEMAGDAFVTNLTLFSTGLLKKLDLSVSVYNLFDERYADPVGGKLRQNTIGQDGRSFRVKFT